VNKQSELLYRVRNAIEAQGAIIISVDVTGSGHRVMVFDIAGRRGRYFFATSPKRGKDLNAITTARRVVRATMHRELAP
jgi:hypothetical protein